MANIAQEAFQKAILEANRLRKHDAEKRLAFYHDEQLSYLHDALARKFAHPSKLTACFVNVVKKVVDLKARVYADEPKRTIDGSDADILLYQEIAEQSALGIKMKLASRYAKLLKTLMVRPVWRNNRLDLDVLPGDILDVIVGDAPEYLESVLVTHYGQNDRADEITYSVWTLEAWERLDYRGRHLDGGPNPYGMIPFVPIWDRPPTDCFWLAGGDDLVVMQEAVNKALVDLLYTLEMQGFGVGWMRGGSVNPMVDDATITVGPGRMIQLPQDGELGFAATQAPIDEVVGAIDRLMKWCAVSNGLPGSSMSVDPTDESGVSKIVGNVELEESRRDDIALWRVYERRLFTIMRAVWNHHNPGRKLSDSATLAVDFADPKPDTSEKDQAATWELLLSIGLISPVDAAMERNPDLATREDALAYLMQVRDETAALSENKI